VRTSNLTFFKENKKWRETVQRNELMAIKRRDEHDLYVLSIATLR
jgi:hypothetical protein